MSTAYFYGGIYFFWHNSWSAARWEFVYTATLQTVWFEYAHTILYVQRQKAATAHYSSEKLLSFAFAEHNTLCVYSGRSHVGLAPVSNPSTTS